MKKPTNLRLILLALIFFQSYFVISQNLKSFTPRFDKKLKGDMLLIGNNILNRDGGTRNSRPNVAYNDDWLNSDFDMRYIDVDNDNSTFSSSSATLTVPKPACYKIVYAGLYWGAILQQNDRTGIDKVKLKLPTGGYHDINGQIIHDANAAPIGSGNNRPYACYADITDLVAGQANAQGVYTVANVISSQGSNGGTGLSAGWSIYVVYEDPTLPAKYITSFDGFSAIGGVTTLDIPVSGFKTIPTGPVRVKFAFAALEGDQSIAGDYLQINGIPISATNAANTAIRASNNFFNSSVTYVDPATDKTENFLNRSPASTNTLGYDAGILNINNPGTLLRPGGIVIDNNETSANIRLGSTQDVYFYYFNAFAVDIIEPHIVLTKIVKNSAGTDIGGQNVVLGQQLNYEIGIRNSGNDDAKSLTIRDQLPINIIFNYPGDLNPLPAGVSVQSYDPATRSIVFKVDDSVVKANTLTEKVISFKVKVVPDCNSLSEACSNSIDNSAYATYKGTLNPDFQISDDPSVNTNTGCILTPKATNFLVGVDGCKYTANVTLCKDTVDLVAANGYTSYTWYSDEARTKQIGTGQTLTVKDPGTYYVYNLAAAPCRSIYQAITVTRFGATNTNPVIPYAKAPYKGEVLICPNNGKELPNLFLCGANDSRLIETHISDGSTLVWEKLDESSCTAPSSPNCANEGTSCTWTQVATGPNYLAKIAGQYRLTLNYAGGCFNRFYFNVFTNSLSPTEKHTDIICGKAGTITVGGVPAGYEYSINGTTYQASNVFNVTTAGFYTVYIRLAGVTGNTCIFTVPNIQIRQRNFNVVQEVTQPLCYGEKGKIKVAVNDANAQYYYKLYNNGTLLSSVGPVPDSEYTFDNLNTDQNYVVEVTTDDGCKDTKYIYVGKVWNEYKATVALVEPLTACSDGKIRITTEGGNSPYNYFINSDTVFQTSNEFVVTAPGLYTIKIVDKNNCTITRTITVPDNAKPAYTIDHTNSNCYDGSSKIEVKLTAGANGYTMGYSINGGVSFQSNPVFSNLQPGTYDVVVRYGIGTPIKYCTDPVQKITITGPTSAISASAGVAALAGCTLPDGSGANQGGKLRINNVQGGTPAYQFSFDGGVTWQASNEKDVLPGNFILQVKDALGCIFEIPYQVTLDPKPADPTITVADPVFGCNGMASTTVTVTNPSNNYTYEYYINGTPNTPITNNVFTNVPSGTHTIKVKYKVTTVPTYSNLLTEDFGRGPDTTTPGIHPNYCWEKQDAVEDCGIGGYMPILLNDGEYVVTQALLPQHVAGFNWNLPKDNTAVINNTPQIKDGRFLAVNVGGVVPIGGVLYKKTINDVIPNQDIQVSLYMLNLLSKNNNLPSPRLTIQLQKNGVLIPGASKDTQSIPRDEKWHNTTDLGSGQVLTLNPGNNTSLDFVILSYSQVISGNDLAVDDIWVRQIPEVCGAEKDFPIVIGTDKAFKASIVGHKDVTCNGANNGEITLAAQNFDATYGFDYSLDNGATWVNSKTSPVTVKNLTSKTYNILIRYDNKAGTCSFPFDQPVGTPAALTITASVTKTATCTTGATITAVAGGGTPAYQYELRAANGITVITAFQNSGVFANVPTGTYTVVTRDAYTCSSSASAQVNVVAPTMPTASLAATSDYCVTGTKGATLVVTATGTGALTYSLNGAPAQTSHTFTNVGAGTHTITVTDSNNCPITINGIVIAPELKAAASITKTLDCTTPNATIKVDITDGVAAYTYKVKKDAGAYGGSVNVTGNTFNYPAPTAGLYTFEITDSKGCKAYIDATISPITNPTVTANPTQITCNGLKNGSVQLVGAGGSGGYEYNFNNLGWSTTSLYSGLDPNISYSYQVRDSKGCTSAVGNITLTQPTAVSGTIGATIIKCGTPSTVPAVVTVTGSGGTGAYTYSFNGTANFTTTNTYSTTTAGTVTAYVRDANNCQFGPLSITIGALEPITDITIVDSGYDCSTVPAGGRVTLTAVKTGSTANVIYQIISGPAGFNPATNTTGNFTSLTPGDYIFQATDTATNCSFTKGHTIKATSDIVTGGSVLTSIQCFGSTGTIEFTVNGVKANGYDYVIKNAANTIIQQATGVSAATTTVAVPTAQPVGAYTITATDRLTKCQSSYTVTLTQSAAAVDVTAVATTVNCNKFTAEITATGTGGTPNYTYAVARQGAAVPTVYASNNVLTVDTVNGTVLNWVVYIKDANGCLDNFPIKIDVDAKPVITSVVVDNQCQTGSVSSFTITATATGLVPLTYSIDGTNFQTSNTFTVSAGSYTVTVKDKNGCTTAAAVPVVVYPKVGGLAEVTKELDCSATPNATIKVDISGGKTPYTYTVAKGSGTPGGVINVTGTSFTISVASANADKYTFAITDANGCSTTTSATVAPIAPPTVTAVKVDASCNGSATGTVQLTGANGSGGYTYSKDNVTFAAASLFENLLAGNYTFYVKDSKGCTGSVNVTIGEPGKLTASATATNFTCSVTNTKQSATVTITATDGTAPYTYSFNGSGYTAANTLTVNDNGADQIISYSVRDAKGCTTAVQQITIKKLDPPVIVSISGSAILCSPAASTTSTVTVTTTNGVGALAYVITAPASATSNVTGATTGAFSGLVADTYTFKVTDANGCFAIQSYTVLPLTPIAVAESKLSDVLCNGGNTGSARFTISGFSATGNYTVTVTSTPAGLPYTTSTVGDVITLNGLVMGSYTLTVQDKTTNCSAGKTINITQPAQPLNATLAIVNANCHVPKATVTVTATGGTTAYSYAFVQNNVTPASTDYKSSNSANLDPAIPDWDVWVKDANGCVIKLDAAITTDAVPDVTASVTNQCTSTGTSFIIKAVGTGGIAPLTYSISSGVAPSPADTFTVTSPGTYVITVKDANNCTDTVTVTVNSVLTASAVLVKDITCAAPVNATITVNAGGGLAPYTYLVSTDGVTFGTSPDLTGNTFTTNTAGDYYFQVTDASGCTKITNKVVVTSPQTVTGTAAKVDPTCNGYTDGSVTLTATAGVSPFTYSIDGGTTFVTTKVFGGLASGTYTYVVKDAKGCTSVPATITLVNPAPIVVNIVRNAILCNLNTPGSFDVNVTSGGTAPYVYTLYDNAFTQIATYTETSTVNPTPVYKFAGLNFGDYYITVVDANGCEYRSGKLRIETPPYLKMSAVADSNNCATGVNVTVTTSGGTPDYKYSIFGQPLTESPAQTSPTYTFIGLKHGTTYFLQVKDINDCISILEFQTPPPPSSIKITGTAVTDVTCNGTSTGILTFTVRDFDPSITTVNYEVLNALTLLPVSPAINSTLTGPLGGPVSGTISTLKAGNYVLRVTEAGGTLCSTTFSFTVSQPVQPLKTTITKNVNATCNVGAQVTLTTIGGTGPYEYAAGAPGFTPTTFGTSNVLVLDYTTRQNWDIVVRDAKGCIDRVNTTIGLDPSPVIALSVVNKCVAEGAYVVRVSLTTAGISPYEISVNGGVYAPVTITTAVPYDVTGLNSGLNTISIKDANGCIDTKSITIDKPLGVTPVITTLPTCANNDGVITLTPIGGAGPFTYSIAPSVGTVVGNVISGVPAGTYTITITDTNTLCTATAPVKLSAPTPVDFDAVVTNATCNGSRNGTITVNLAAGSDNPVYTYSILPVPVGMVQTDNVFSNLPAGTYSITVFSGRGCSASKPFTVGQPLTLAATAAVTDYACNTSNVAQPAVVTVNVTAGTGTAPYKYNFDGSANYFDANTLTVLDNGAAQTISYYVKDANGCLFNSTVTVNPYQKITDLTFTGAAITCNAPATSITVTVAGGYAITKYEIVSPTANAVDNGTVNVFNGLLPGTYVFKVTDANGCSFQKSLTIKPVTNITVSGQLIKDVSCNEVAATPNGSVEFTVGNFAANYTYSINGVAVAGTHTNPKVTLTNLAVGNYKIDVVDVATGCVATANVDVSEPATPLLLTLVSNVNANCNFGAKVSVVGSGGTPGYTYAYAVSPTAPAAGAYNTSPSAVLDPSKVWIAYVKDANGCIAQLPLTIATDPLPSIDPITGVCYDGSPVNVTLVGHGVGPLTYSIGNGFKTSPDFVLNAPGSYTFYVRDANGCDATTPYVYQLDQKLLLDAVLQDLTCAAPNMATVTLTATQGSTVYTNYEVSFNGGGFTPTTSPYTTNIAGTYTFRVTDSKNCQSVSKPVVVNPIVMPTISTTPFNVSCNLGNDGSITITAGSGLAPYEYSIDGTNYQTSNIFGTLTQGTYTVYVRDAKKCVVNEVVTISEPTVLGATAAVTPFGCTVTNTPQDAVVTLTATNGTPGYKYSFDNGVTFGDASILNVSTITAPKTVFYVVIDANGCRVSGNVTVNPYTPPTDMDITATPIYCNTAGGVSTATVNTVTGGVGPYKYEIVSPAAAVTTNTIGIFPGLLPDTYQIKVTDANGCSTTKAIVIKESDKIKATTQLITDVLCNGGSTGTASFVVNGYITPADYIYSLAPLAGTATKTGDVISYTGLAAGIYTFTVVDRISGCQDQVVNFEIKQPLALDFTSTATNTNCNNKTAQITITATGGTPAYRYAAVVSLSPAPTVFGTNNVITVDTNNGANRNWDIYVQDLNGCPVMKSQTIVEDVLPTTPSVAPFSQCPDPLNGTYTFTITGVTGVAPIEYSIGGGFQSSPTFTVNTSGTYDVTVKDGNGCEVKTAAVVNIFPALALDVKITALPDCNTNNGAITATASGGSTPANYSYSLNGNFGQTSGIFTNIGPGNHTITVTDVTTGCTRTVKFEIIPATPIKGFTLAHTDVTCNTFTNGTITATIDETGGNDNPIYYYSITAGPVLRANQTSNVFTGLPKGQYTVTVTSGRGCKDLEDVEILEPTPIVVSNVVFTQFGCTAGTNTNTNATITVNTVTGGSGTYVLYQFMKNGAEVQNSTSNTYTVFDLAGGDYTVNVYDSKGCIGSSAGIMKIVPFISLDNITVTIDKEITCVNNEDITVTAAVTGGTPTPTQLLYSIKGIGGSTFTANNTTGVFTALPIGNYLITVENTETKCIIEKAHYVTNPNTFEIKATPVVAEICFGTADGSVNLTFVDNQKLPSDDAGIFDYTITGPVNVPLTRSANAGPVSITGLRAGQYTVNATLVGKPYCSVSTIFSIGQPTAALVVTTTKSEITCVAGNNDGEISASATGGWDTNYQYDLVLNGAVIANNTNGNFTGLSAGNYTVNVKDGKGCQASATQSLKIPDPIVVSATATASVLPCFGDRSGIITVNPPTGGQGSNYMYTLNMLSENPVVSSGPQSNPVFTGLPAGTYSITVTDGFTCSATSANVVITEPTEVVPSLVLATTQTCNTQSTLTLSATGGSGPYTYSKDQTFTTTIGSFATSVTFPVAVGKYQYYVKDAKGCVAKISNEVKIDPLEPLVIELDVTNAVVKCMGEATGVIVANAKGGLGNYIYTLENNAGGVVRPAQPTGRFEDLPIGTYVVKVASGDCPATSGAIEIKQPATAIQATFTPTNVSCFGESNGQIVVAATGGTGVIKYAISPDLDQFDVKNTFDKLAPGKYTVIAQDENGCYVIDEIEITQPKPLIVTELPNSMIPEVCKGDKDGAFSIEVKGGTAPYSVSLDNKNGTYTQGTATQTIFDFNNLSGGVHTVYVKDAQGCVNEFVENMPLPVVLDPTTVTNYDCVNNAQTNMVIVTVDESNTDLTQIDYSLDSDVGPWQAANIFTNIAPGTHYIVARHTNGCKVPTASFEIRAYEKLTLAESTGKPEMNIISVTAAGGAPGYEYSFNGESFTSSNKYKIYKTGDYVVVVRDQNGCTATITVHAVYVDVCLDNYFTPNGDGVYDTWGPGCTNIYNNLEFSIFDRYGRVIAKYRYGQKWDGRYNGAELPSGDYWYVLKLNDEKDAREFVGHFTLYR
ncbi:T9SS type B sorting domain-containing protein [Flavobacterium tructae]|uniref:T9SS type B sorting domain-containing protein n=1 Tax=Flavobacterium tructae TaxID=1114873 RepID=UPI0035A8D932